MNMIQMYCIIVRQDAWARLLMVNGYCNTVDQPRSVLGFYGRLRERSVLFPIIQREAGNLKRIFE